MKFIKDSKIHEKVIFNKDIPINIFRAYDRNKSYIVPHLHEAIEIIYITQGHLKITDSSKISTLKPNDLHIFNTNSIHSTEFHGEVLKGIVLQISFSFLTEIVPNSIAYKFNFSKGTAEQKKAMIQTIESLLNQTEKNFNFSYIKSYELLMHLIYQLFNNFSEKVPKNKLILNQRYYKRIYTINSYITKNYFKKLTLTTLSQVVHLNPNYLSRFISKYYGMSFYQYLCKVRLKKAQELLQTTDMPILQIAEQTGFANYAQFNKEYKAQFSKLPSNMRKNTKL